MEIQPIIRVQNFEKYRNENKEYTLCKGKLITLQSSSLSENSYIISETDDITGYDIGNKVYDKDFNKVLTLDLELLRLIKSHPYYKVLVEPSQFPNLSPTYILDLFYEGEIYLECYRRGIDSNGVDADLESGILIEKNDYYCVRFNELGRVNIIDKKSAWNKVINEFVAHNNENIVGHRELLNDMVDYFAAHYQAPIKKLS